MHSFHAWPCQKVQVLHTNTQFVIDLIFSLIIIILLNGVVLNIFLLMHLYTCISMLKGSAAIVIDMWIFVIFMTCDCIGR